MLRFLRVADLRNLLGTFRLTKSGKREDLLRRLERLFSNPVLVQRCGGKTHVEEIISYHYNCVKGSNTSPKVTELVGVLCDQEPVRAGQNRKTAGKVSSCNAMTSFGFSVRDLDGNDAALWARVAAADPFWAPVEELDLPGAPEIILPPSRLRLQPGTHFQSIDRNFHLTSPQIKLLCSNPARYQLQIACVLYDDLVPTRLHWPFLANVKVNGRPQVVMVISFHFLRASLPSSEDCSDNLFLSRPYYSHRQPGPSVGKAGRDPSVCVDPGCLIEGTNTLIVQGQDQRFFYVIMRLVKLRSLEEVRSMVPAPVPFSLARFLLEQKLRGSDHQNDHDDDIVIQGNSVLSLRCPISGQMCKTPARTRNCKSLAIFDLDTYLELNAKVRKWVCPHCGSTGQPHDIVIDGYLSRVIGVLRAWEQSIPTVFSKIDCIEVGPNGTWRPSSADAVCGAFAETWISSDALSGVVLGHSGSILHIPFELKNIVGNECHIVDAVFSSDSTYLGKESKDKALKVGRMVESDVVVQPSYVAVDPDSHLGISELAVSSKMHDVIVISDSDDDRDNADYGPTPKLKHFIAPEGQQSEQVLSSRPTLMFRFRRR